MDRTTRQSRRHTAPFRSIGTVLVLALAASFAVLASPATSQDNVLTGTSSGVTTIRIAVADFKPLAADPETTAFKQTFDSTLYADLASAGIFDIVSKSLMPPGTPGAPSCRTIRTRPPAPPLSSSARSAKSAASWSPTASSSTPRTSSTPR